MMSAALWLPVALALASAPPRFHVEDRVRLREETNAGAAVCLVHLHGNEENARSVMLELHARRCAKTNALFLDDARSGGPWGDDRIPLPLGERAGDPRDAAHNGTRACSVNPNRVLTPAAQAVRIRDDCDDDAVARAELARWVDGVFLPALARCRGGDARLPVVTFHNNSILTAGDMDARTSTTVKGHEHDILFVTRADDYAQLARAGRFTIALQNAPAADDGSLSVLLQRERYVNVEAQIYPKNRPVNLAMGEAALALLAVDASGCAPAPATR